VVAVGAAAAAVIESTPKDAEIKAMFSSFDGKAMHERNKSWVINYSHGQSKLLYCEEADQQLHSY
jgi:hypothetical protein